MVDLSKGAAWIEGQIVPISEAKIGVTDWGLTHSDITYDVVPVWNGGFFRLPDYMARFQKSIANLRLDFGMNPEQICEILHRLVASTGLKHAYVAMVASRGGNPIPGSRDPRDCVNHFYAWCVPYVHIVRPEIAEKGVRVWVAKDTRRIPTDSVNSLAKNYHWGDFTLGLFEAKDAGFETVILLDHHGNVTEGPGFNIFILKDKTVTTANSPVLHGITRLTALELCKSQGFTTETRALPLAELHEADEVFLTSSGGGIIPVSQVGDRVFSNGVPGPVSMKLRADYFRLMDTKKYRKEIEYTP